MNYSLSHVTQAIVIQTFEPSILNSSALAVQSTMNLQGDFAVLRQLTSTVGQKHVVNLLQRSDSVLSPATQNLNADGYHPESINIELTSNGDVVVFAQLISARSLNSASLMADGPLGPNFNPSQLENNRFF